MEDLMKIVKRLKLTKDDLITEAECVAEYGEWLHLPLMGYPADILRQAAENL